MLFAGSYVYIREELLKDHKCFLYLKRAADKGGIDSQVALAKLYFFGKMIPRNFEQAFYYNYLVLRYEIPASYALHGLFNFFGIQIKQDFTQARVYLEKYIEDLLSSDLIDTDFSEIAWICLSAIHLLGLGVGVSIDDAKFNRDSLLCFPNISEEAAVMLDFITRFKKYYEIEDAFIVTINDDEYFAYRTNVASLIINFMYIFTFEMNKGDENEQSSVEFMEKLKESFQRILIKIELV